MLQKMPPNAENHCPNYFPANERQSVSEKIVDKKQFFLFDNLEVSKILGLEFVNPIFLKFSDYVETETSGVEFLDKILLLIPCNSGPGSRLGDYDGKFLCILNDLIETVTKLLYVCGGVCLTHSVPTLSENTENLTPYSKLEEHLSYQVQKYYDKWKGYKRALNQLVRKCQYPRKWILQHIYDEIFPHPSNFENVDLEIWIAIWNEQLIGKSNQEKITANDKYVFADNQVVLYSNYGKIYQTENSFDYNGSKTEDETSNDKIAYTKSKLKNQIEEKVEVKQDEELRQEAEHKLSSIIEPDDQNCLTPETKSQDCQKFERNIVQETTLGETDTALQLSEKLDPEINREIDRRKSAAYRVPIKENYVENDDGIPMDRKRYDISDVSLNLKVDISTDDREEGNYNELKNMHYDNVKNFFMTSKDKYYDIEERICKKSKDSHNWLRCREKDFKGEKSLLKDFLSFWPQHVDVCLQTYPLFSALQRERFKKLLNHEYLRLCSFQMSQDPAHDNSWITQIAAAGFYCSGERGQVTCFSCGRRYNSFLAGIPLSNAHEPHCRWQETNLPIGQWASDFKPEDLNEFYSVFQNAGLVGERRETQNTQSSATMDSTVFYCEVDTGYLTQPSENVFVSVSPSHEQVRLEDVPMPSPGRDQTRGSLGGVLQIAQEDSPGSSRQILTSATKTEPHMLRAEVASNLDGSVFGAVASDNGNEAEPLTLDLSGASYPQFANRTARLETFLHWPVDHTQRPEELVQLGFFYSGYSDCARCFYCGLGLKYWRPNDNAAYQHARFRPHCVYNRLWKGQDFIDQVQCEISQQVTSPSGAGSGSAAEELRNSELPMATPTSTSAIDPAVLADATPVPAASAVSDLVPFGDLKNDSTVTRNSVAQGETKLDKAVKKSPVIGMDERIRLHEKEHEHLRAKMFCNICKVARIGCVYLPCGHVIACQECGDRATTCIMCSKHIAALANIYMP